MIELADGRKVDPREYLEKETGLRIKPIDLNAKLCRGYALMWIRYPSIQERIKLAISQSIKYIKRQRKTAWAVEKALEEKTCGTTKF